MLFNMEICENMMYINYNVKYDNMKLLNEININDFIDFICKVSLYFNIQKVIYYCDYVYCDSIIDDIKDSATVNIASSYCYDIYKYLKSGYKKFTMHNDFKPVPAFTYEMLDLLENVNVDDILKKKTSTQRDNKLYYIYHGDYLSNKNNKRNCKDFFIWLVENKCGYIDDYITSLSTITDFKDINPFTNDYYIFYPIEYLINEGKIKQNPYMNIYSRDEIANDINKFINKRIQRFRVNNDDSYKRKNKFALNEGKLSLLYLYD